MLSTEDLLTFLTALSSELKLDRLMRAVLDVSLTLTNAGRAFLLVFDDNGEMSLKAALDSTRRAVPEGDFDGSTSIIRMVMQERRPLYIEDFALRTDLASSESVVRWNLKSALCLPLHAHADQTINPVGILYLDSSAQDDSMTNEHFQLMQTIASFVAISIANARLFEQVERQQGEIAALNQQLQKRVDIQASNLEEMRLLLSETQRELGKTYGLGNIVGGSDAMLKVFKILEKVVGTHATVLIQGESGTGKELAAKYLHYNGPRAEKPLVTVNCSALSETLLESELFGHRKGAFTGATQDRMGLFQVADGGTLFLDEVGDMSSEMQKKLLRVLQEGEVRPVGGREAQKVDVRIISATNRDLRSLVQDGVFREDLFYRLNVISVHLPSLRDRRSDLPLLIDYFTHRISDELERPLRPPTGDILDLFLGYDWPGNVRQLENELRRVFILESEYEPQQLGGMTKSVADAESVDLEKTAILKALESAHGNKSKAAELIGMPRRTFYRKLIRYGIY
ncbi:MAG: sigma-54-dependent Fis family transcriptional regulator [Acidobacteria bacterium]|nr:sigma-54-dependent Fis family transcriptional regulator [Acidobacteriota bacterium]